MSVHFKIPLNFNDLRSSSDGSYEVSEIIEFTELNTHLKEALLSLNENGPEFIFTNFAVFYLVLAENQQNATSQQLTIKAYEILLKAIRKLIDQLTFQLGNEAVAAEPLDHDAASRLQNLTRMTVYIFIQYVLHFERAEVELAKKVLVKADKAKKSAPSYQINKLQALHAVQELLHTNVNQLWPSANVEVVLINLITNCCHELLQNLTIRRQEDEILEIFGIYGVLIKRYNYGTSFASSLVHLVRTYEHVGQCISGGVRLLVDQFQCRSLLANLVAEATDWRSEDLAIANRDAKECGHFLVSLAELFPNEINEELDAIVECLHYDIPPIRIAAVLVLTELLLRVYAKIELDEEMTKARNDIFEILLKQMQDVSPLVRGKVSQSIARLQQQTAIPIKWQNVFLSKLVIFVNDKNGLCRKYAIQAVTTCLEYNSFGAQLNLSRFVAQKIELDQQKKDLLEAYETVREEHKSSLINIWSEAKPQLEQAILNYKANEENEPDIDKFDIEMTTDAIRNNLKQKKIEQVVENVQILIQIIPNLEVTLIQMSDEERVSKVIQILEKLFFNEEKVQEDVLSDTFMSKEDFDKWHKIELELSFLNAVIEFIEIINKAMKSMRALLFGASISDCSEVFKFFTATAKFQMENITDGILEMLKVYKMNNAERNKLLGETFRNIYLQTNTNNMNDHSQLILKRLMSLIREMSNEQVECVEILISDWTKNGVLDNSVIDMAWKYYTKRIDATNDESRLSCELLRMCALGRASIIEKNVRVVTSIAFDHGAHDMLLLAASLRLLALVGRDPPDSQSLLLPAIVAASDPLFSQLVTLLIDRFASSPPFYANALSAAVDVLFQLCSSPLEPVERLLYGLRRQLQPDRNPPHLLVSFFQLIGTVAIQLLIYLDIKVHRESKRRNIARNAERAAETGLEGAVAVDDDAEFILHVLEVQTVMPPGLLGVFVDPLTIKCQRFLETARDDQLQKAAITALVRCMLVSSKLCRRRIKLVFDVLGRTKDASVKCLILMHSYDLLTRFPNIVEPFTDQIFMCLSDEEAEVRHTALLSLSSLILKDMIRAYKHLADIAVCLIDSDETVREMTKNFYMELNQKEHAFESIIPDVFGHLSRFKNISNENLFKIIKYLMELVGKMKKVEVFVERMCLKFTMEDMMLNRNLIQCLELVAFNEKALMVLHEKFPVIREHVHDAEIYASLKSILMKAQKAGLKPELIEEIERMIASVFEAKAVRPRMLENTTKKRQTRTKKGVNQKGRKKQRQKSLSDNESS